jgi:hypothetical protein
VAIVKPEKPYLIQSETFVSTGKLELHRKRGRSVLKYSATTAIRNATASGTRRLWVNALQEIEQE